MSFKIDKDIGKIGEFVHVDFDKREPLFEHIEKDLEDGLYIFEDGDIFMVNDGNVIRFKPEENK